ncbi:MULTISPECIES: LON peptidase substrate-binding domain-containing protein [unclassified Paracoccus (in: a-proteobacteria)]|uniref:LON peptidase substrate-binding domain-containing protein n=1 Tax=unclassified Paracoccus (in: a-proteobacteria) TaxID=2688777 RepID=UPI0012B295CB|nr:MULTISPECIES: LON peptidase substrate-binding domain-containing protein [unclassified Paracoccus (in: a-proteobacteria)]UXU75505.1 LON peptidase substrate-binding domain-containing protein [Paracoccus sp. SMMA_5]UXU81410.1 LON peptidase substrate-binding domain-containing protein [Paracoccus sp. SMMA_5_TC]
MLRGIDLPDSLALFPLSGAVLLPRTRLPLQIFEPRYLQMVEDVLKTPSRLIGMIQPAEGGLEALAAVGCAGRISAFSELDDGRLMISLRAISRFRLEQVRPGFTPYLRGQVSWAGYDRDLAASAEEDAGFDRAAFVARLQRYLERRGLATDAEAAASAPAETLINSLSMLLPLAPEEKQALLEAPTLTERRALLEGLLEYALHGGDHEETLQ